jgi:inner membrane protein
MSIITKPRNKSGVIVLLALLLCLPLYLISATIDERAQRRDEVTADIAASTAGSQTLAGPVLVLPYQELVSESVPVGDKVVSKEHWVARKLWWLPDTLDIQGNLKVEPRYRGIYSALLYAGAMTMTGSFSISPERLAQDNVRWGQPYVALGLSDMRGITSTPLLKVNDQMVTLDPASNVAALPNGLHATLGALHAGRMAFRLQMDVRGTQDLRFLALGRDTSISLSSAWPSPSFNGRFLPAQEEVSSKGFNALWRANNVSSNMEQLFGKCMAGDCAEFNGNFQGVRLITPIDVYMQSARAEKYGFLFVVLTFLAFYLFEVLKELRIHPVQYLLVGVALILFFLLLLSLAEHIPFMHAYLVAATACIGLQTYYISHVLRSVWRGLGFGLLLSTLFAALYGLLQSEDNALLLGSLLLFIVVAAIMVVTRRTDWYGLDTSAPTQAQ